MATRPRLHPDACAFAHLVPAHVAGIPCLIGVASFTKVPPWRGSPWTCPSDWDYYGYTDMEWEVLDRRGRRADWLARKLNARACAEIESDIERYYREQAEEARIDAWVNSHS